MLYAKPGTRMSPNDWNMNRIKARLVLCLCVLGGGVYMCAHELMCVFVGSYLATKVFIRTLPTMHLVHPN